MTEQVVRLDGAQTINRAEALAQALKDALAAGDGVAVDCGAVAEADLTLVQLLLAARATAAATGKRLRLDGPPGPVLRALLTDAGVHGDDDFWSGKV